MKYVKSLSIVAALTVITTVFAGSASADYVTTTTGGAAATPKLHAVNENGHVVLSTVFANITCSSTIEGPVQDHGAGRKVSSSLTALAFTGCTNSWHVTTLVPGVLEIEWTSGHNGTVFSEGAVVHVTAFNGAVSCIYETFAEDIGTITGGNPATLHIEAILFINTLLSSPICGSSGAVWEGNYVTTGSLYVANS